MNLIFFFGSLKKLKKHEISILFLEVVYNTCEDVSSRTDGDYLIRANDGGSYMTRCKFSDVVYTMVGRVSIEGFNWQFEGNDDRTPASSWEVNTVFGTLDGNRDFKNKA